MISGDPHAGANPAVLNSDVVGLGAAVETLHKGLHASLILQHLQVDNVVPADFGKFPAGQAGLNPEGNRNSEVGTRGLPVEYEEIMIVYGTVNSPPVRCFSSYAPTPFPACP